MDFGANAVVAVLTAANLDSPDLVSVNNACRGGGSTGVVDKWNDSAGDNGYSTHFPVVACIDGESPNARMDDVFTAGTYEPAGAYSTYGANILDILRAQGRILNVVHESSTSGIRLTYDAPEIAGACVGVASAGAGTNPATASTVFAATDTPGTYARTLTITGLSSATTYSYTLTCAGGVYVRGEVTTQ